MTISDVADYETQTALYKVANASNPLKALEIFKENESLLKDWRVLYADVNDVGPFKLQRKRFTNRGLISSVFRGKSIWVLDSTSIHQRVEYRAGSGLMIDSNCASYIRSMAYQTTPSSRVLACVSELNAIPDGLRHINPNLYLWEAQRNWNELTVNSCCETLAAVHALKFEDGTKLDINWGLRYRSIYKDAAEALAKSDLAHFQKQLDEGLREGIAEQVNAIEAMLVRAKIIELSSRKSPKHKLEELIRFMHDDLSIMMVRELIICADILLRSEKSSLSKKLHSLQNRPEPLACLTNCAWDLYFLRVLDQVASPAVNVTSSVELHVWTMISFDEDIADIFELTELSALALHKNSSLTFPFFNLNFQEWLDTQVGEKRMNGLNYLFQQDAFQERAERRSALHIQTILNNDRLHLLSMLQ